METNDELYDKYVMRYRLLEHKFDGRIITYSRESSIYREWEALNTLMTFIRQTSIDKYDKDDIVIQNDGAMIASKYSKEYSDALEAYLKARDENNDRITPEDEARFKLEEIDFLDLKQQIQGLTTLEDCNKFWISKLYRLAIQRWPLEIARQVNELKSMWAAKYEELEEQQIHSSEQTKPETNISENKFSEIYGRVKRYISGLPSRLVSMFKEKSQEKDNEIQE